MGGERQVRRHTEQYIDEHDRLRVRWVPHKIVNGVPYDTLILGYHTNTANTLRLWRAEAPESFDFAIFNSGDYYGAVNQKVTSENLSKVLYPNDEQLRGKELRLEQQYFFVSCSLQDMFRILRTAEAAGRDSFTKNLPCSSTTRIRRSPSPNSCACWSMNAC
jgi:starch phosphorylase